MDGAAELSFAGSPPVGISLEPHGPNGGFYLADLDGELLQTGKIMVELDTTKSEGPVSILLMGHRTVAPPLASYPEQTELLYREFLENTLLAGSKMQITELTEATLLHPGDTLQVHASLYVEEQEDFTEIEFTIPAGASLSNDGIQHAFEPSTAEALIEPPGISFKKQLDPLKQVIRMEPFSPGRHEFILSYRINWAGTFGFPKHRLIIPKTGQAYEFGSGEDLVVDYNGE